MKIFKILKSNNKGFTLIELLVATSIFTMIALAAIMVLMSSQRLYKRISSQRVASDNVNLILDTMIRDIQFGTSYSCINNTNNNQIFTLNTNFDYTMPNDSSSNDCNAIAFIPQGTTTSKVVYYFNTASSSINRADYDNDILIRDIALNSTETNIDKFWVNISGSAKTDSSQAKVKIFISGIVDLVTNGQGIVTATSTFMLESTLSQKTLDN